MYGIFFRLDSYGSASFFVKEDLKAVDLVSIKQVFSSFDNNIVGILWSDGKLRNGSREKILDFWSCFSQVMDWFFLIFSVK